MIKDNLTSRDEIINSLEQTYQPKYIPILTEFKFTLGEGIDFKENFDDLMHPLLEKEWLIERDGQFILTKTGKERVDRIIRIMRFHQNT
jgi:hypothetical protein